MAQDTGLPPRRASSLFFPILLIGLGLMFLYWERHPDFDVWGMLWKFWPLILIFLGLAKMWDSMRRKNNPEAANRPSIVGIVLAIAAVLILVELASSGRTFRRWRGGTVYAMQHLDRSVDRNGAKTINASVEMSAGDLSLSGGSTHLLEADFDYRSTLATPRVEYSVDGTTGRLNIVQDEPQRHFNTSSDNHWTLHLANDVPIDLRIEMGAGRGNLRLRDIDVTHLSLQMGAGQVDLDLTGDRKTDLTGSIEGGVGEASIRLPKNVGVLVTASGGLGSIDAGGLKKDGDEYTNDVYGKTPATIRLKVEGGIGRIVLTQE